MNKLAEFGIGTTVALGAAADFFVTTTSTGPNLMNAQEHDRRIRKDVLAVAIGALAAVHALYSGLKRS